MPTNSTIFHKCSVPDCPKPVKARGYCVQHYTRWLRHGLTSINLRNRGIPTAERFWMKVDKRGINECWPWLAHTTSNGYGRFKLNNRLILAHRMAYEMYKGPIPESLTLDHLCRNRICVNPAHLEPVTLKDNNLRGFSFAAQNAKKTHCAHDHPFDLLNTYFSHEGGRACRKCRVLRNRKYKAKRYHVIVTPIPVP